MSQDTSDDEVEDSAQSKFVLVDDVDTLSVALDTLSDLDAQSIAIDTEGTLLGDVLILCTCFLDRCIADTAIMCFEHRLCAHLSLRVLE